jgi:alkanesulfonate monooxygenase SsuD/methylene tetrahydromethanopterin reductase-like flavin-dependent oxidoreductase (luciferase family)
VLSGGRVTLAACTGPNSGPQVERELALFGLTHESRVARMEDWVRLLRFLSTEGRGDFHGEAISLPDVGVEPGFVQRPLPLWMVANPSATAGPKTLASVLGRVGRLGDGWMTFGANSELIRPRLEMILAHREAAGLPEAPDFPVCVYVDVNVDAVEDAAVHDALATNRREGRHAITAESLRLGSAVGSKQRCLEFLEGLVEAGATNLAIRPLSRHPQRQIALITEHLVPALTAGMITSETRNHV